MMKEPASWTEASPGKFKEAFALDDVRRLLRQRDLVLLILGSYAALFNLYVAYTVLPLYVLEIGGSAADAGWQTALFTLSAVLLRTVLGPLADRKGRRLPLIIGSAAYGAASLCLVFADSLLEVALVRVVQAAGSAAYLGASSAMAVDLSPPDLRATSLGVLGVFKSLAVATAPPLAMAVAEAYGFAAVFGLGALMGAAGTWCVFRLRHRGDGPAQPAATVRPRGPELYGGSRAGTPAPAWLEVLRARQARNALVSMGLISIAYGAVLTFVPVYGEELGLDGHGYYFSLMAAASMAGGLVTGWLSDRLGRTLVVLPVLALHGAGVAGAGLMANPVWFAASAALVGLGFAGGFAVLGAVLAEGIPHRRGLAFSLQESAIDIGIAAGSTTVGLVASVAGYPAAFAGAGAACLLWTAALGLGVHRGQRPAGVGTSHRGL